MIQNILYMVIYEILIPFTVVSLTYSFKTPSLDGFSQLNTSLASRHKSKENLKRKEKSNEKTKNDMFNIAVVCEWLPNNTDQPLSAWVFANAAFWIKENNCRVIPLLPWKTFDEIKSIINKCDGIMFMGGMRTLNPKGRFEEFSGKILSFAKEQKIPTLAICQGFQLIVTLETEKNILQNFNNTPSRFQSNEFTRDEVIGEDVLFSHFTKKDKHIYTKKNVNLHFHQYGISEEQFKNNGKLANHYSISTLGKDKDDKVFINSIFNKKYPIHAVQYHPECGNASFYKKNLNRSPEEIVESQEMSRKIFSGFKSQMTKNKRLIMTDDNSLTILEVDEKNLQYNEFYGLQGFQIHK